MHIRGAEFAKLLHHSKRPFLVFPFTLNTASLCVCHECHNPRATRTLSLSHLDLEVDYSRKTSIGETYRDYVAMLLVSLRSALEA